MNFLLLETAYCPKKNVKKSWAKKYDPNTITIRGMYLFEEPRNLSGRQPDRQHVLSIRIYT